MNLQQLRKVGLIGAASATMIGLSLLARPANAEAGPAPSAPPTTCIDSGMPLPPSGNYDLIVRPALSVNSRRVAFVSTGNIDFTAPNTISGTNYDQSIELMLVQLDGSGGATYKALTNSPGSILGGFNLAPSISADGRRVAFFSDRDLTGQNTDRNFEIFFADVDASLRVTVTQVTTTTIGVNTFPSLSRDGNTIVFESDRNLTGGNAQNISQLFLAQVISTGIQFRQLTNTPLGVNVDIPVLNVDGSRVAYIANATFPDGPQTDVFVALVTSTTVTSARIATATTNLTYGDVAMSGDGTKVVYVSTPVSGTSSIVYADISAWPLVSTTILSHGGTNDSKPSISDDGGRVTYVSQLGASNSLVVRDLYAIPQLEEIIPNVGDQAQPGVNGFGTTIVYASATGPRIVTCALADLQVQDVTVDPPVVAAGARITQTFNIVNPGPSDVLNATVLINFPPGATSQPLLSKLYADSDFLGKLCAINTLSMICTYPVIPFGQTIQLVVAFDIGATQFDSIQTIVQASANLVDRNPNNNVVTHSIDIQAPADLILDMIPAKAGVPGRDYTMTFVITDVGPAAATNVSFTLTLPPSTTTTVGGSPAGCTFFAGTLTCPINTLARGQTTTESIVLKIDPAAFIAITGTASVTGSYDIASNSTIQAPIKLAGEAELEAHKQVVETATVLTFTLSTINNGPSFAHNVVLTDVLPVGLGADIVDQIDDDASATGFGGGSFVNTTATATGMQLTPRLSFGINDTQGILGESYSLDESVPPGSLISQNFEDNNGQGPSLANCQAGSCPTDIPGIINFGKHFDGSASEVQVIYAGTSSSIALDDNVMTIMAWVRQDPANASEQTIVANRNTPCDFDPFGFDGGYNLSITGHTLHLRTRQLVAIGFPTTCNDVYATAPVLAGQWAHVAAVISDTTIFLYVNGVDVTPPGAIVPLRIVGTRQAFFGRSRNDPSPFFGVQPGVLQRYQGDMDEVAFFRRAFTSSEMANVYAKQNPSLHGSFISRVIDSRSSRIWDQLLWRQTKPVGVPDDRIQVRVCVTSDCSDNPTFVGPDGTAGSFYSTAQNALVSASIVPPLFGQYFQYRALVDASAISLTAPVLNYVEVRPTNFPQSSDQAGRSCSLLNGNVVSCAAGTVPVGAAATFTFSTNVTVTGGIAAFNTVSVTASEFDPITKNNSSTIQIGLNPTNITVGGFASPNPVNAGAILTITAIVSNTSPGSDAHKVILTPTFPSNFTLNVIPANCDMKQGPLLCNLAVLPGGSSVQFVFTGTVNQAATSSLNFQLGVTTVDFEPTGDNFTSFNVAVSSQSQFQITTVLIPDPPVPGQNLTQTWTITNLGPSAASTLQLALLKPSASVLVGSSLVITNGGTCNLGGNGPSASCVWPAVPVGSPRVVTLTGVVPQVARAIYSDTGITNGGAQVQLTRALVVHEPTGVVISGPQTGQQNVPYEYTATLSPLNTTVPLTYVWSVQGPAGANTVVQAGQLTTIRPLGGFVATTGGLYTIAVTVTSVTGVVVTDNITMSVNVPPTGLALNLPTVGSTGTAYALTATVLPAIATVPFTYTWSVDSINSRSALVNAVNDIFTFSSNAAGTHRVVVTATSGLGAIVTATGSIILYVPPTQVNITGPTTGNVNTSYSFTAAVAGGGTSLPLSYVWYDTGTVIATHAGVNSLTDSVATSFSIAGLRTISVVLTGPAGAVVTSSQTISLFVQPATVNVTGPAAGVGISNTAIGFSATVLPAGTSLPLDYVWFEDGVVIATQVNIASTTESITRTYNLAGTHSISVTVTSPTGFSVSDLTPFQISIN